MIIKLNMNNNLELLIKEEYICPICGEIPHLPVQLKVIDDITDMKFTISSCLKNWTCCNDIFCKSCILKFIYHAYNDPEKKISNIKCPICSRRVLISSDMNNFLDCIVENKKLKRIVNFLNANLEEFECKFNCGLKFSNLSTLEEHMINCPNSIISCKIAQCKHLMLLSEENDHNLTCQYQQIKCPFCNDNDNSYTTKDEMIEHLKIYHQITNPHFTVTIENILI